MFRSRAQLHKEILRVNNFAAEEHTPASFTWLRNVLRSVTRKTLCDTTTTTYLPPPPPNPSTLNHLYLFFCLRQKNIDGKNFFPSNAFLRRRRKKALLRVNDRGGGWKMCILALCRVCVCVYARPHVTRTSAVNLRRYGNTPQTITIHDLVEISLLCAAHATIMFS